MPSALVEKKASYRRGITSGAMPLPVSCTTNSMLGLPSNTLAATCNSTMRSGAGRCAASTDSAALRKRLTSTCSIKIRSTIKGGRPAPTWRLRRTLKRRSSISANSSDSASMGSISESVRLGSLRFTKLRMR